ncbi:Uncharacterised protein [Achromobacter xylosoxidans]|nr:Uncharacterised protein [Achromobacter xylosoxidans]
MRPASARPWPPPWRCSSTATSSGVSTVPSRLDAVAAQIAPGTLPRAIDVKAIDDCTVDDNVHTKITPSHSDGVSSPGNTARNASPSAGNRMKVHPRISACSRTSLTPATIASVDKRAPCRKNNSEIATLLATIMNDAPLPTAGKKLANATVAIRMRVNWSGRKRRMAGGFREGCGNYRRAACYREGHWLL